MCLIPAYSEVLPREVNVQTRFSRNISLNIPIVCPPPWTRGNPSAWLSPLAREGGIGVIHKNMTIAEQAAQVHKVKRAENQHDLRSGDHFETTPSATMLNLMKEGIRSRYSGRGCGQDV